MKSHIYCIVGVSLLMIADDLLLLVGCGVIRNVRILSIALFQLKAPMFLFHTCIFTEGFAAKANQQTCY